MKKRITKLMTLVLAGSLGIMGLVGCGANGTTGATGTTTEATVAESTAPGVATPETVTPDTDLSGTISLAGSTSMEKVCEALMEGFMEKYPSITVTTEYTGSGAGLESLNAGSVDIATCVRVLGSYSYDDYINLTNYLLDGNLTGVSSVINFIYSSGVDMKLFTNTYLSFIMDVLKYCYSRNISNTKIPVNFESEIIKLVDFDNSANYYQYYMDNLLKLKNMIKGDDDPLTTIEIVFNQIGRLI